MHNRVTCLNSNKRIIYAKSTIELFKMQRENSELKINYALSPDSSQKFVNKLSVNV